MVISPITQNLSKQGDLLFRWRSYIPLALLPPGFLALSESASLNHLYGEKVQDLLVLAGFLISITGLAIRWFTVGFVPAGTSGRNTKTQRARRLNTDGLYSIVRNPLYLGNFIAIMGVLISTQISWLCLLGGLSYWLYIERIIAAEENFLIKSYGKTYLNWAVKTPAFIPDMKLWKKPKMTFCFRTVLRREYNGLMAICSAFLITEAIKDVIFERESFLYWAREDWPWITIFAIGTALFILLRTLKKTTRLLHVTGR